jgi:predicted double-glycine peptidase
MTPMREAWLGARPVSRLSRALQTAALLLSALLCCGRADAALLLATPSATGTLPVHSWKAARDARIVKQNLDYSCGAAALATILQSFYGMHTSEEELLDAIGKNDAASFADMARVLPRFGFKAVGISLSFEQLQRLKIPALLHLRHQQQDHFTVLRGIGKAMVWLGDPSWGNRRLSAQRFLAMWEGEDEQARTGKALLVLPLAPTATRPDFFGSPASIGLPLELLTLRPF